MVALSVETKSFLEKNIRSAEELDILLHLRANSSQDWDSLRVAKALKLKPLVVSNILMRLSLLGLIGHQDFTGRAYHYRYSVHPKVKEKRLSEIAVAFEKARTDVIDLIFASQKQQLSAMANAFKFRKED